MAERMSGARHPRIYIEEWQEAARLPERKALAARMGVSPGTISKKLARPEKIDIEWLEKFRAALGLASIVDLFRDPATAETPTALDGLTDDERAKVIEFAAFLRSTRDHG